MKNILLLSLALLCISSAFAQKTVTTYYSAYWDKELDIMASEIKDGNYDVYIQIRAKRELTKAYMSFKNSSIPMLISSLTEIKNKYSVWSKTAKENNVTTLNKEMGISVPSTTISWYGSKWFFAFNERLTPVFIILDNGENVVNMTKKVTSSSNQYIDETVYIVFESVEDIDNLIQALDLNKIEEKLNTNKNNADLFI